MGKANLDGVVTPHLFVNDWPLTRNGYGHAPINRHDGIGPTYSDDMCESCDTRMLANGECRCSA